MAPVAGGKRAELTRAGDDGEPILDGLEVGGARVRPVALARSEAGGLGRVGGKRAGEVDPVEGMLRVEVDDAGGDVLGGGQQVAHETGVRRQDDTERALYGPDGGEGMDTVAGPADALGKQPRVARVTTAHADREVLRRRRARAYRICSRIANSAAAVRSACHRGAPGQPEVTAVGDGSTSDTAPGM